MQRNALLLLRTGLAITFIWVGVLILRDTSMWAYPILPWAKRLLTVGGSLKPVLQAVAVLDILVGAALILNLGSWIAATVGVVVLTAALVVTGASGALATNFGLLGACLATLLLTAPDSLLKKLGLAR
ncbi:MAG: hypothetical protein WCV62_00905 [Candidatus Peribacteraceae bacterium]|jgi:uncharacterized membrane protein YphA (DoxX/SURF4 family)